MPTSKAALITGATGTLGHALVKEFVPHCHTIINNGRDTKALHEHNDEFRVCRYVSGDLRDTTVIKNVVEEACKANIDVAILCAGTVLQKPFGDCELHELGNVISTNLFSTMALLHGLWYHFINRKAGTIVVVNSMAGKRGNPDEVAYCASKFGLRGMVESLSQVAAGNGVRLVGVYPGAMKGPVNAKRSDHAKLLHPSAVAKFIADMCFVHTNLRLDSVDILRTEY